MSASSHGEKPPPGPPWDQPLAEAPLAFVDLEMTGLDFDRDRILEICVERVVEGVVNRRLCTLVRPGGGVDWTADIHGIAPADVASAPTFADIAGDVVAILDGAVFVAHAAMWDARFLDRELGRAGHPHRVAYYLDTLVLSRRVFGFQSHALGALSEALGAPRVRAHRAADDVAALRHVFAAVVAELKPKSPRDLWHTEIGRSKARPGVLATLEKASAEGCPVRVRYRPSGKRPVDLVLVVTALSAELDPPRVIGYLLPGRGRRELRTDRILAVEPAPVSAIP